MKLLGIDYGKSKIGVAAGDTETMLAEPIKVIPNYQFSIINFQKIINDQNVQKIIIGLPNGKMDEEIKKFGEDLGKQTGVEVEYFDETLTTQDAQRILIETGGTRKKRKAKEDAVAAAIMLQLFMEVRKNV